MEVICSRTAQEEEELQVEEGQQGRVLRRRDDGGSVENIVTEKLGILKGN